MDTRTLFDESDDGPVLRVHVQPGAGGTKVTGTFGSALKVRVAAPPEAGRANEAVRKLIAATLDVDEQTVELAAGEKSRSKRLLLRGADAAALVRALEQALADDPRKRERERRPQSSS